MRAREVTSQALACLQLIGPDERLAIPPLAPREPSEGTLSFVQQNLCRALGALAHGEACLDMLRQEGIKLRRHTPSQVRPSRRS